MSLVIPILPLLGHEFDGVGLGRNRSRDLGREEIGESADIVAAERMADEDIGPRNARIAKRCVGSARDPLGGTLEAPRRRVWSRFRTIG